MPVAGWTDFNYPGVIRMGPGMWLWERMQISDGRFVRLVTSMGLEDLRRTVPAARFVSLPPGERDFPYKIFVGRGAGRR